VLPLLSVTDRLYSFQYHHYQLYEVFEDEKYIHLVEELCSGGAVMEVVPERGSALSEKDAALVMRKVLDAIDYCHRVHNVCHR